MKRTPAAKSVTRCRPIQRVLTPGWPSPLRAREPPSMATRRTLSFRLGSSFGMGLFVNTCAARISSGSNLNEAGNSGQLRPGRISRAMRQDTTMNSVSARSISSGLASCSASTRQPFFKTRNSISISQHRLGVHLVPQGLVVAHHPVVLRAHQQIDRPAQRLCPLHQPQDVALAVAHLHQPRLWQRHRAFGQPLVAFNPAQALVDVASLAVGVLGLARPHPRIQQPKGSRSMLTA